MVLQDLQKCRLSRSSLMDTDAVNKTASRAVRVPQRYEELRFCRCVLEILPAVDFKTYYKKVNTSTGGDIGYDTLIVHNGK